MSLIGEAELGSPLLQAALATAPDTELVIEDIRPVDDEVRLVFWALDGDLDAFEAGLETDPTVGSHRFLTALGDRRLYRVTLSERGVASSTYDAALAHDIVVLDHRVTDRGMWVRARVPDREALTAYRGVCRDHGIPFELTRLYRVDEAATESDDAFGVTAAQRAALVHALEAGYFDVPRRTDLQTMATELDVSPQALSTRLRRGQANLVANAFPHESI
ncbi:helix-turn-helix domain-containing protein [Halorarius litoreus]|uniref:helix-turn-helix domain-containing protein n=1 Tax=Halorarius litoreus TaxID=2962676 RepID=UPI0020CEBBC8|nr:helix-turn-helix domain-containing protein [Halorarius litoreus]